MFLDDGSDPDVNKNTEFMWCANIVDKMEMGTLLSALDSGETETVTVAPWCGQDGFTEERTTVYGLSDGTNKTVDEGTALEHHYTYNAREDWHICDLCKAVYDQEEAGALRTGEYEFDWADDYSSCNLRFVCEVETCDTDVVPCVVTQKEIGEGTIEYTATCTVDGQTYTDVQTVIFDSHTYGEPEFNWSLGCSSCTATFTCTDEDCDYTQTVDCKVTSETIAEANDETGETKEYTATCTINGKTYSDTKTFVNPFTDVQDTEWYYEAVIYNYTNGIMEGMSQNTFEPGTILNRAMIAQILYNMEGRPAVEEKRIL